MTWTLAHVDDLFSIITSIIAVAAAIAALTPTPKDDGVIAKVRSVINWLAFNFGHAKNK